MNNLFELENKFLEAKLKYYNETPIMTDAEFDALEKYLKEQGSKVIYQVGAKTKDFDFAHPTPMLSLGKIQTEENDDTSVNFMTEVFMTWFNKRIAILGGKKIQLESSAKYDGNAINAIYIGGILKNIVTRGEGDGGKDVTVRLLNQFPRVLSLVGHELSPTDIVELRCEVVIEIALFDKKYGVGTETNSANPRNYVAGVLGSDTIDSTKCSELMVMSLHLILNGEHIEINNLNNHKELMDNVYTRIMDVDDYEKEIQWYIELREKFHVQLDGVVISLPVEHRTMLGQNDHDPEWAIAIKFVPEEAVTDWKGYLWAIGKTGEFTPVILLEPVQLAGTSVKKASAYNAGYVVKNKIGPGTKVSIAKAGDIIPEIQSVIIPSDSDIVLPTVCPHCGTALTFDDIHLMCNNTRCKGRIAKQLASNASFISLRGIGPKTIEPFAEDFEDLIDVIVWVRTHGTSVDIENYGIKHNSRSHENFLKAFNNIKFLTYGQMIVLMSYNNVGLKLAELVAKMYNTGDADFSGHNRSIVAMFDTHDVRNRVQKKLTTLVSVGIEVEIPAEKVITADSLFVCMTGSPKTFGFATKKVFTTKFGDRINEVSLSSKDCQYLITDDLNSKSSKMKSATKKGIEILTYSDFEQKFS